MSERSLPPQVLTAIGSPIRETRLTGVEGLVRIATGDDLELAAVARMALLRMTEDDSRSVATAASTALERTAMHLNPDRIDFGTIPPDAPRAVADVFVEGPSLAVASATVTVSGPGLRAVLNGRQLRIIWQPRSHWLDGLVTVRGPAGWADVRVTGQAPGALPQPTDDNESPAAELPAAELSTARLTMHAGVPLAQAAPMSQAPHNGRPAMRSGPYMQPGPYREQSPPPAAPPPRRPEPPGPLPPPPRRNAGTTVLVAVLTVLVLIGGVGVVMALRSDRQRAVSTAAQPLAAPPVTSAAPTSAAPDPAAVSKVPLASRVRSVAKPAVVGTIKVGDEPEGLAVSPDGRTVYVADQHSHVLSVVDAVTHQVTAVRLSSTPRFVATSRDGKLVFVSMYEDDMSGSGVAVIDAAARKVTKYLSTGYMPYAISVGPDGRLWVPIHSDHRVEVYSAGNQSAAGRIQTPPNPHAVGFSEDLSRGFTPDHESNVVSVIDLRTNKVVKNIPVSKSPHSLAVSPDGRRVLIACFDAKEADLIDAVTLKRTAQVKVGDSPQSVAFATDGGHGYIVNEGDDTISVLDGHTGKVTATIKVGHSPRTVTVSSDGRLAYVSNGDDDTITVLRVGE
jgi:YVTN family beta-propeller protein